MADNVTTQSAAPATPAAGSVFAADDIGGVFYFRQKVALGPNGTATADWAGVDLGSGAGGAYVRPRPLTTIPTTPVSSAGLTTSSTGYSIGDCLGTGWTVPNAALASGGTGKIIAASITDYADVTVSISLFFAQGSITFGSDNAAPSISDADSLKLLPGIITLGMTDLGANRFGAEHSLAIPYILDGTDLYVYAVTNVAHTFFGAVTDLRLRIAVAPD